jgi:hypothetical protein
MKRLTRMDDLFAGLEEPFATFHDATLRKISLDYDSRQLSAEFDIFVGDPEDWGKAEPERKRRGVLSLAGLVFWAIEPPQSPNREQWLPRWLTGDCLIEEASTDQGKRLSALLEQDVYAWCMYFSDSNSFVYCAAHEATFEWTKSPAECGQTEGRRLP